MANMLSNINPEQALGLYQESLAIRRDLTKTQPGDFLTLRDLTISLNNVADMLEHSDPRQALELYQESPSLALSPKPGPMISRPCGISVSP